MNEHVKVAYLILWAFHPVLETAVALVMWRRNLNKTFPAFYAFLLWGVLQFAVLFPIYIAGNYAWYYYCFWGGMAVDVVLGFRVIHEIFLDVFRPYHTLKDLGTVLFKWAALVMLLVSAVVAFSKASVEMGPIVHGIYTLHQSVRMTQCGLILFLLVFSSYLGISWRQKSFGMALGFGSFATTEMGVMVLNMGGYISMTQMNIINMVAFNMAFVLWLGYMAAKSPARDNSSTLLQSQRWEESLNELHHPVGADSLIPMFEGMVERAFSRSSNNGSAPRVEELPPPSSEVVFRSESYPLKYSSSNRDMPAKDK
jgi:hypothetical protein